MKRRAAVITGSRAEFGLLEPVMRAIERHSSLELRVVAAGAHLIEPAETWRDIEAAGFPITARVPMQIKRAEGATSRADDALAAGRGLVAFTDLFRDLRPGWVVVLGDRIEAFAAAAAASISGVAVAHLHGGDRAEGIADESLRRAVTCFAHLHLPATPLSAQRLVRMGENPDYIHCIGSPAIDGLESVEPMSDNEAGSLGDPAALFLMHPSGIEQSAERAMVSAALAAAAAEFPGRAILCLTPNHDPGREAVLGELERASALHRWPVIDHLPRPRFLSLLKRLAARDGLLLGNSSAGLIEAAALRLPAVNIGPRQRGRETPDNTVHAMSAEEAASAIRAARRIERRGLTHPYGDGRSADRVADLLARTDPASPALLRKRCTY